MQPHEILKQIEVLTETFKVFNSSVYTEATKAVKNKIIELLTKLN